jgi:lipoate-protein ligase A
MPEAGATWRLLDTGTRDAASNVALDAALLELRSRDEIPNTLRFLRFSPAAALVGYHQSVSHEVRLPYCEAAGIDINRRITGGGAVLIDSGQLGWEMIARRGELNCGPTMAELTALICRAAADGLNRLGIAARFRPRNDIEVDGRKISGSGGAYEGDAFLFQGTLLVDFDVEAMLNTLRVPTEKLARHELDSARDRVVSISQCLPELPSYAEIMSALTEGFSSSLGFEFAAGGLTERETRLADELVPQYASDDWISDNCAPQCGNQLLSSARQADGALVRVSASIDHERKRLKSVLFTGDFFIEPQRAVYDLETSLKNAGFDELKQRIDIFFAERQPDTIGLDRDDFRLTLEQALAKIACVDLGIPLADADSVTLVAYGTETSLAEALEQAAVLLLPYCAKSPECEYRSRDGCDECGDCGVGEAYSMARDRGIVPITVCDYQHLEDVFEACRQAGVQSYVGCCCQAFFIKRHNAFAAAGMTGVLLDIEDETCYDLSREEEAYRGRFENQTSIKTGLLARLLDHVERREIPAIEHIISYFSIP